MVLLLDAARRAVGSAASLLASRLFRRAGPPVTEPQRTKCHRSHRPLLRAATVTASLCAVVAPASSWASTGCDLIHNGALNFSSSFAPGYVETTTQTPPTSGALAVGGGGNGYRRYRLASTFDAGDRLTFTITFNGSSANGTDTTLFGNVGQDKNGPVTWYNGSGWASGTEYRNNRGTYTVDLEAGATAVLSELGANSSGTYSASISVDCTPGVGPANKLAFGTQPADTTAGSPFSSPPTVRILDASGNLTSSTATVTLAFANNAGSGTLSGTVQTAAVAGIATFNGLSINKVGTGYTLSAASTGLTGVTSNAFNVTAGAATQFAVSAPSTATAGTPFNITVTAQDSSGNTATGYSGTVQFSTTGTGNMPGNSTLSNGVGTFSATFTAAGTPTITAKDTVNNSITGTSGAITVTAGPGVTGITPAYGVAGSSAPDSVTISGSNFGASAGNNTVTFGGVVGTITSASASSITVTPPANATAGQVNVVVTNTTTNQSTTVTNGYRYVAPPSVNSASFSPTSFVNGDASGSTLTFTIQNSNAVPVSGVTVTTANSNLVLSNPATTCSGGTASVSGLVISLTTLAANTTCNVSVTAKPSGSYYGAGTVTGTIAASGSSGTSFTLAGNNATSNTLTIRQAVPTVGNVSPASGSTAGGSTTTITGTNFDTVAATGAVKFGSADALYTVTNSTTIAVSQTPTGSGTVHVSVTNEGGTSTAVAADQYTYVAPPTVTSPTGGSTVSSSTPTYAGTAAAGSTVQIFVDSSSIGTATLTGTSWTLTQPTALSASANHQVYAVATLNGVSLTSSTVTFASKATQTITSTSTAPSSAKVFNGTYALSGTASSGLTVAFSIDASASSVCSILSNAVRFDAIGTCVINFDQAGDSSNYAAPRVQQSIPVSKADQTLTFGAPPTSPTVGGSYTPSATSTRTFDSVATGLTATFTIDASSAPGACSISSGTVSFTGAGSCVVNANQAGDATHYAAATQQQQTLTIAATVPGAPTIGTATAGNGQATVTFTAPASNGGAAISSYTVTSSPGGITATGSASPITITGLTNTTSYTFTVTATNIAGPGAPSAASNAVTPEAPPVVPTINSTPPALTNSSSATFAFTLTNGTAQCRIDSGSYTSCTSPQTYSGLGQGGHTFDVRATNGAGTSAPASYSWTIDTTAPNPPTITVPANGAFLPLGTTTVTGTAEANSTVSIYIDGVFDKTLSAGTGNWTTTTNTALAAGSRAIKAQATDGAGNVSGDSNVATVTVAAVPSATVAQASVTGTVGAAMSVTPVTATGGAGSITYSVSPTLPAGLTINSTNGLVSGTPTVTAASASYTVTATDQAGQTGSASFQLVVNPTPTPTLTFATPGAASVVMGGSLTNAAASSIPGGGAITYSSSDTSVATVSATTGAITTVSAGTATITATQAASTGVNTQATQTYSLTVHPLLTTTQAVPSKTLGQDQLATPFTPVTATGGVGTLGYAVSPSLPAGLSLSPTSGAITGTPTATLATTTFTVTVTDQTPNGAQSSSKTFQLTVTATPTPTLTFATPGSASVVMGGSLTNAATSTIPGGGAITYGSSDNSVATVSATTGAITTVGAGTATITATQAASAGVNTQATQTYTLTVHPLLTTTQAVASISLTANVPATSVTPVTAAGGVGTLGYAVSPALPAGLSISPTSGAITGTPTATLATTTFTVTVTDQTPGGAQTSSKTFNLTVTAEPTPVLSFATPGSAGVVMGGALTNAATSSIPGGGAITYGSGNLGIATVNASTGAITPVGPGTTVITATQAASAGVNGPASQTYTLTVYPLLTTSQAVASTTLVRTQAATPFTPVTASGGSGTLGYAVSPALPNGLAINPSTGEISGTPAVALAATSFTVTVTDQTPIGAQTSSKSFSLAVTGAPDVANKSGVAVAFETATPIDLSSSITGAAHTSIAIGTAPAHGGVTVAGDIVTYTPTAGYYGADSFTYTATGPGGTSAPATVSLTVANPPAPTAANKSGVAVPYAGTGTPIDLSGSITGVHASIAIGTAPAHGTVTIAGDVVTYTPAATYYGADSFTYIATGPGGTSAPATVSLTVATPGAPVVSDKNGVAVPYAGTGTPIDLSGSIAGVHSIVTIGTAPARGTVSIAGDVVTYTPAATYYGADSFTFTATGPGGTSNIATVNLTVANPSAPTAANKTGVTVPYASTGVAIDLSSSITGVRSSIAVGTVPAHGTFTVTGEVVTYVPAPTYYGPDSFTYTATGPGGTSSSATVSLNVATPAAPTAADRNGVAVPYAGTGTAIDLSGSITGVHSSITIGTAPAHGSVSIAGDVITYTPGSTYYGADSFTFTATGPGGTSNLATVTLTVGNPPAPGAANKTGVSVPYASTGTAIDLAGSVTGVHTSIAIGTAPAHGTATVTGDVVTYTPASTYFGADSFTYAATGPGGTSAAATVGLTVATPSAPTAANKAGVAIPYASAGTAIDLSGSITGVHGSITIGTAPAHGSVSITGDVVTFTPAATYYGTDSFTYTATGPGGTSSAATVSLTVATPSAPTAADKSGVAVGYGSTGTAIDLTGSVSGVYSSIAVASAPAHGSVAISGSVITYTPAATYYGADSFTYTATGPGGTSAAATVSITVATPSAPVAADRNGVAVPYASTGTAIDLSGSITGVHGSIAIGAAPAHGTVAIVGDVVTYTPAATYYGVDSFTYTATGPGGTSAQATVRLTVATPPAPVSTDRSGVAVTYASTGTAIDLSGSISGVRSGIAVGTAPAHGTVTIAGEVATYTPAATYYGADSFTYTATGPGGTSAPATVTVTVATPAAPTVSGRSGIAIPYASTGTAIDLSGSISGVRSSVAVGAAPAHGTVSVAGEVVTYVPAATYYGADSFTYTATGPGGTSAPATVAVTVATPPAPAVTGKSAVAVAYNSSGTAIDLSGSITGVRTSIAIGTAPAHGTVTVSGEVATYIPTAGYYGADAFTFTASGPGGTSAAATVTLAVTTPPAPVVADKSAVAVPYASTGTAIDLSASITGVRTSIAIGTAPAHGTVTIAGEVVTYVPAPTYYGTDSFTYTATGPGGTSSAATVSLAVATPAAPVAANKSGVAVGYNSGGTAIDLAPSITGVHTGLTIASAPAHGTVTVSGDVVTYVPASGYFGADSFTYSVTGPGGTSAAATVSLSVAAPPPPVAAPGSSTVAGSTTTSGTSVNVDLSALVTGVYDTIEIQTPPQHGSVTLSGGGARQATKGDAALATPIVATYTPAPNYAGSDSFTFVAVGPGGRSAPGTVTITVVGQVPVALPKVATTGDGQTVSVMLTDGAARGPFTGANVVSVSPANSATTTIVASGAGTSATYRLDVTPNNRFGGTIVVTYTLTNIYGTSAPSTVTLTVQARPDPRNDPNVGAISDAQAEAARRFARAQVSNFMRRTEQLHNGGGATGVAMGVTLAARDGSAQRYRPDDRDWGLDITDRMRVSGEDPAIGRYANNPQSPLSRTDKLGYRTATGAAGGTGAPTPSAAPGKAPVDADEDGTRRIGSVATWAGGAIDIGTRDKRTDRSKITATTAGLSAGADIKLADGVVVGLGGGYGNDLSEIGTAVRVRGTSTLYAAYASIQPADGAFVDGVVGRGKLDFTTRRLAAAVNATARGSRDGSYTVAAISLGIDRAGGPLQWSVYGRGEYMGADLDAYTESGAGRYNLRFNAREVHSLTGTIGARFQYRQKVSFGSVTPRIRAEWNHEFADVDAQWLDYADIPGSAIYALQGSGWKREQLQLSIGTRFDILNSGWSFDFETGLRAGQGEKAGTLQIRLSKQF